MKPIRITQADIDKIRSDFEESLKNIRLSNGSFSFTRSFTNREAKPEEKAYIYYTSDAYTKMKSLVTHYDSEVGWHGLVRKIDDKTWLVYDVLVYPQDVTGATVNTDQDEYVKFLQELSDEQAQNMFFHGHSHVNMSTFASSVDMDHRDRIVKCAKEDGFWIFQIWNKRGEISSVIYDLGANILYDTKDIELGVLFEQGTLGSFIADADSKVRKKTYSTLPSTQKTQGTPYEPPKKKDDVGSKKEKKNKWPTYNDYYDADDDLIDDGTRPYGYGGWYS